MSSDGTDVLTISTLPLYMTPEHSRVSSDVRSIAPVPSPEFNENPRVTYAETHYNEQAEPIRDLDFDPDRTRRGYIAYFLNPAQFWQADRFSSGKVMTGKQSATTNSGGMAPFAQRANIPTMQVSSYGDLLTASTDGVGIDPVSGW